MRNTDIPLVYRYEIRIKFYDDDFNVRKVKTELYRLRKHAEERAEQIKREHTRLKIISTIDIIRLEDREVINTVMSKHAKQKKGRSSYKRK